MFQSNLRIQLTNFFKTFFINHENASVTALISFKLDDNSDDYFVKVNFSGSETKNSMHNGQSTLRIQTSPNSNPTESEIVSESSVKENSKPKSSSKSFGSEFEDKEAEFSDEYNNISMKIKNLKNESEMEFQNVFLSNSGNEIKAVLKNDRRKSKRPQRKVFENPNDVNDYNTKVKALKLLGNISIINSASNIKKEDIDYQEINNSDNSKEKFEKETSNSIIISNDHKILPSILALNGISSDNSILTSALMNPSNGLTILSQNAYNILRSVGSLTVSAQSNSIPILNTCVSLSNTNTTQSNVANKNKGLQISSSNIASISINQQISQAPTISVISADNNITTTTTQNSLRAISTITTSRQSVPSQVVTAHSSKLYKCRYCCKTFNRKFCRERHERLHTGIKPYTCEICNDKFIRLEDKKRHVRSTHSGRDSSTDLNNGTYLSRSNSPEIPSTKI